MVRGELQCFNASPFMQQYELGEGKGKLYYDHPNCIIFLPIVTSLFPEASTLGPLLMSIKVMAIQSNYGIFSFTYTITISIMKPIYEHSD